MKIKYVFQLIRPLQWAKNGFVFFPLFFSGKIFNVDLLIASIFAFFAFSFVASAIYCLNDICDAEMDREHPVKCNRPIASNSISKKMGIQLCLYCLLVSLSFISFFEGDTKCALFLLIIFYFLLNLAYTLILKRYAIIDVVVISVGFVLRVIVGGKATNIPLSEWIILMSFLLALFLAFAKRRDDLVIYQNTGVLLRKNVNSYNLSFLNQVMTLVSTITIVAYIMYTTSPDTIKQFESHYVYLTSLFVLTGIIRYLQITIVELKSGNPTNILVKDYFIQICIFGWIISFLLIIYL